MSTASYDILEEEYDANYEPTQEEIVEYAEFLGMDLTDPIDRKLMYLAREGLKAPLPDHWKPCKTGDDNYYFNFITGESIWDHPCDKIYKEKFQKQKAKLIEKPKPQPSAPIEDSLLDALSVSSNESESSSESEPILKADIQKKLDNFSSWIHGTDAKKPVVESSEVKFKQLKTPKKEKEAPKVSKEEIKGLEEDRAKQLKEIKLNHEKEVNEANEKFEEKKLVLEKKHTEFLSQYANDLQAQAQARAAEMEANHEQQKQQISLRHEEELRKIRAEGNEEVENEKVKIKAEKDNVQKEIKAIQSNKLSLEEEYASLQKKLGEISKEVESEKASLESSRKEIHKIREREVAKHEAEILALKAEHNARLKAENTGFNQARDALVSSHERAMSELNSRQQFDFEAELAKLKSSKKTQMKECEEVARELHQLRLEIDDKKKQKQEIRESNEAELKEMEETFAREVQDLGSKHKKELDEMIEQHVREKEEVETNHKLLVEKIKSDNHSEILRIEAIFLKEKEELNLEHKQLLQKQSSELTAIRGQQSESLIDEEKFAELKVELEAKLIDAENRNRVDRTQYRKEITSLQEELNRARKEIQELQEEHINNLKKLSHPSNHLVDKVTELEVLDTPRAQDMCEVSSLYSCDIRPIMDLENHEFPEIQCLEVDLHGEIDVVRQMLGSLDRWKSHIVKRKSRLRLSQEKWRAEREALRKENPDYLHQRELLQESKRRIDLLAKQINREVVELKHFHSHLMSKQNQLEDTAVRTLRDEFRRFQKPHHFHQHTFASQDRAPVNERDIVIRIKLEKS